MSATKPAKRAATNFFEPTFTLSLLLFTSKSDIVTFAERMESLAAPKEHTSSFKASAHPFESNDATEGSKHHGCDG
jgi:hypothetical protein